MGIQVNRQTPEDRQTPEEIGSKWEQNYRIELYQEQAACKRKINWCIKSSMCMLPISVIFSLVIIVLSIEPIPDIDVERNIDGTTRVISSIKNPPVTDRHTIHFASDVTAELLSLNFRFHETQLITRKKYFLDEAWDQYLSSLSEMNVINTVIDEKLVITAIPSQTPIVTKRYQLNGRKNWQLDFKVLQTIQGASDKLQTSKRQVSITLVEVPRSEELTGLKIRNLSVLG